MSNLLQDMQHKCDYFYNKYTSHLDRLESKMQENAENSHVFGSGGGGAGDNSFVSDISDYYS
jgi:hypothetical protein